MISGVGPPFPHLQQGLLLSGAKQGELARASGILSLHRDYRHELACPALHGCRGSELRSSHFVQGAVRHPCSFSLSDPGSQF